MTPLHTAATNSKTPAVVQTLLDAGAAVNARAKDGRTPLHQAAKFSESPAIVQMLLDAGANPAAKDQSGRTPFDRARFFNDALKGTDAYRRLNEGRFE